MKVQSTANSYNYQANQNTKKQPAFGKTLYLDIDLTPLHTFPTAYSLPAELSGKSGWSNLCKLFKELPLIKHLAPPKIFGGKPIVLGPLYTNQNGYLAVIDKDSKIVKAALKKLPADFEKRYDSSQYRPLFDNFIMDIVEKDPELVRGRVDIKEFAEAYKHGEKEMPIHFPY